MEDDATLNFRRHPRLLYLFCLSEMGERFGFYAMRSILVLYMTKILLFSHDHSYTTFAAFSALLYLMPLVGGYLSDLFIETKVATILGGLFLTLGYGLLSLPGIDYFYYSLACIAIGYGFFIPNITKAVGQLYALKDARREGGFSIFYAAINIGALVPPLILPAIIFYWGWRAGFMVAAFGALFGTIIFYFSCKYYLFDRDESKQNVNHIKKYLLIFGMIMSAPLFAVLIEKAYLAYSVLLIFSIFFIYIFFKKAFQFHSEQRRQLFFCLTLIVFSIVFEVLLQQSAMSLTIFVEYNVYRDLRGSIIPTVMFQALNPFFIVILAPVFSKLFLFLDKRNINPSVPVKFAYGTLLMGVAYIIFPAALTQSLSGQISFGWIVLSYFLQSMGELLVSPIGLSMITEMSPKKMMGFMVGIWYFATAIAQILAGFVSQWTSITSHENLPIFTAAAFSDTFMFLGCLSIIAGIIGFITSPKLNKMISIS